MITRWSSGDPEQSMSEDILVGLWEPIRRHPWFRARARLGIAALRELGVEPPARVADVGCGYGLAFEALEQGGYRVTGLDVSRQTLERLDRPGRELIEADLSRALPPGAPQFDAVLAMEIVEHTDDDRAAVARLAELARPGGAVVITVPALPELFSEFDAATGHRRRYVPETLRQAFSGSGLQIERLLWWGSWLVPLLKLQRGHPRRRDGEPPAAIYQKYLKLPPWPVPWAFGVALAWEESRCLRGRLGRGTSLLALARRPR